MSTFPFSTSTGDLIELALREDLFAGDVTSDPIFDANVTGRAELVAKEELVLAGRAVVDEVFRRVDDRVNVEWSAGDGDRLRPGAFCVITGPTRSLLRGERTALNFLRHLSGVATLTRQCVDAMGETGTRLLDTRKTTPGFRELEKWAVLKGGGSNHRFNLGSGAMIKDNHIAAAGSITEAVVAVRRDLPWLAGIEVEAKNLDELKEAIACRVDVVMLDNMNTEQMREAVKVAAGRVRLEASGNVTIERLPELADIGLDAISSGALTHSAPNVDISMLLRA